MATESTAIHNLLHGISRKAIPDDPDDDLLFAGSRREEAAKPAAARPVGMFTLPPPPPMAAAPSPFAAAPRAMPAAPARVAAGTQPPPVGALPWDRAAPGAQTAQVSIVQPTIVPLPAPFVRQPARAIEEHHATVRVPRDAKHASRRVYGIAAGLFAVVMVLLSLYLAPSGKHAAASVAARETKPAFVPVVGQAPPTVTPLAAPVAAAPVAAAPVAAAPVPTAPVAAALPNDAVTPPIAVPQSAFTAKYEPTVTATPIDSEPPPAAAPVAALEAVAAAPIASPPVAKKSKRQAAHERRAARAAKKAKARETRVAVAEKSVKTDKAVKSAAEDLNGNGALAISSGAPREVWVDGRNSKRMTPLRVLLKPGKHTVTLFDKDNGKAKSFDIEIKPNATTKVAK